MAEPGNGYRKGKSTMCRIVVSFDDETFDQVRKIAAERETSIAATVRELVEFGLMDIGETA